MHGPADLPIPYPTIPSLAGNERCSSKLTIGRRGAPARPPGTVDLEWRTRSLVLKEDPPSRVALRMCPTSIDVFAREILVSFELKGSVMAMNFCMMCCYSRQVCSMIKGDEVSAVYLQLVTQPRVAANFQLPVQFFIGHYVQRSPSILAPTALNSLWCPGSGQFTCGE